MKKAKLLLLEDDPNLNETVVEYLSDLGYVVEPFYCGTDAQNALYEKTYDILLLDVNVPELNGFELLKSIRERGVNVPAIFITSRNSMSDVEDGFNSGADDYLRKPFALKELSLRISTILKRNFFHNVAQRVVIDEDIEYDIDNLQLFIRGEETLLNDKEARLLKLFLTHKNEMLSHEVIFQHLWDYDEEPSDGALRTYIKNLRKLIGKERIVSLKRIGYKFS